MSRKFLIALVVGFALGFLYTSRPVPTPEARPVSAFVRGLAKRLLWVALIAEPPPPAEARYVQARVDHNGHRIVDNGRSL